MNFYPATVTCNIPRQSSYIEREFKIIQCTLTKGEEDYNKLIETSEQLAKDLNAGAANNSAYLRNSQRRKMDAFGGLCAEYGWEKYINSVFNEIASPTPFTNASRQIDIQLSNGETIEVRSSFPYKGVKFALCNKTANFKNIGPYSNSIKKGETHRNTGYHFFPIL